MSTEHSIPATTASFKELFSWLWTGYLRKHIGLLLIAVFFMVLEGSMLGALSYMMQPMFDTVFIEGQKSAIWYVGGVMFGIFAIRGIAGLLQKVVFARISLLSTADLRYDLLERLMRQDGSFHQMHPPGYILQRITGDVSAITAVWRQIITGAGRDLVALIVLIGVAINVDPIWALIACIGTPVLILPATLAQRYVRKNATLTRDLQARLTTRLDEIFHGIVPVKLNKLETYQGDVYRDTTRQFNRASLRSTAGTAGIPSLIDIMAGIGFCGVLVYGGAEIISGDKTVGQFMTFFTAMGFAFDPVRRLGGLLGNWQVAAASIERLKELLEHPIELTSPPNPVAPPAGIPDVVIDEVHLNYGDAHVLNGLSFTGKAQETTALVGASGAGKSTIFNVLTRLVDPGSGAARIGGVATTRMDLDDLRGLFSVVTQDALLFDDTIRENILLGQTGVSEERLTSVLDAAHVSDFVAKLPDGLETPVGPRGSALSGGQRQRVVIARALLRDTPILLLDEATSALDAQSERVVQDALERLSKGRTTLVIAHRLSTIRGADKIVVMDRGQVVDEGTHDALLARGGLYADLYRLQFKEGKAVVDLESAAVLDQHTDIAAAPRRGLLAKITGIFR